MSGELQGNAKHLKICAGDHCFDEVGALQLGVLEVAVAAVCCCEIRPPQILHDMSRKFSAACGP